MRYVTDHIVNPENDRVSIAVLDQPVFESNHAYAVTGHNGMDCAFQQVVNFQKGPITEHGVNGVTQEVLLAIVADRLRCFQAGPFACRENEKALTHVEEAMHWLQQRTLARMRRGVEGRNVV